MATRSDVRDVLNLPSQDQPRPSKKAKVQHARPDGVSRELFALYGDSVAPINLVEKSRYRSKPGKIDKRQAWRWTTFTNPARADSLQLHHWRKRQVASRPEIRQSPDNVDTPASLEAPTEEPIVLPDLATEQPIETCYHPAKYNIEADVVSYESSQYETHLRDEDWSKEETDYLMVLCQQFDLRWIVVADRYEWPGSSRTTEDLKARYYGIARKLLELRTPLSDMTPAEFNTYNSMDFDAAQETRRKQALATLAERSAAEIQEEEFLMGELQRIVINQENIMKEREELYSRLETLPTKADINIQQYQGSAGLQLLSQNLGKGSDARRRKNAPTSINTNVDGANSRAHTPTTAHGPNGRGDRSSFGGPGAGIRQMSGHSGAVTPSTPGTAAPGQTPGLGVHSDLRNLSISEQRLYGITYHTDRLTQGPHFRHDKAIKLVQNRTATQAQRVSHALTVLGIPLRLIMPTSAVCDLYEKLVNSVVLMLEHRRHRERLESEAAVIEKANEDRERALRGEPPIDAAQAEPDNEQDESKADLTMEDASELKEDSTFLSTANSTRVNGLDGADEDGEGEQDDDEEEEDDDAAIVAAAADDDDDRNEDSPADSLQDDGRKRSASVLSSASAGVRKRTRT